MSSIKISKCSGIIKFDNEIAFFNDEASIEQQFFKASLIIFFLFDTDKFFFNDSLNWFKSKPGRCIRKHLESSPCSAWAKKSFAAYSIEEFSSTIIATSDGPLRESIPTSP